MKSKNESVSPGPELKPSEEHLAELCAEWQKRLRLQDWRIRVRYAKIGELKDGVTGSNSYLPKYKESKILILPRSLTPEDCKAMADPIEEVLIHELLHLHLGMITIEKTSEDASIEEEQAIESLAWGFFRMKYPDWQDSFATT
jgi:hypothetical protein